MQKEFDAVCRITTYRYLRQVKYMRSYNYKGGWCTLLKQVTFDRRGIFSYGDVLFSKDGSLTGTVKRLVDESPTGYAQHEFQEILHIQCIGKLKLL